MADNFGLKIGLEGEKEFKKALADINQSFKVLGSEMKVVQSQFDKNDDSVEALTARNQVLGKEIDAQKKKIETLRKALENASTSFGENDRRTQQWQIQLNNAQAALNNMERELDQNQRAIDSMGDEMRDAAQQTDKFGDEIDDAADKTDKASGKLEKVSSVLKGLAVTAGAAVAAAGAALAGLTMVRDALDGKIDLIVTKSVSRFARNTVDSLVTVRKLKEKGVEVYFEKENIYTLDSKGELLITIMSSLAQEESRSISENVTWGQRKRFADGKVSLPYSHFLGYRKGDNGLPEIVPEEAETVRWIYSLFLSGKTTGSIAGLLTREGIPTPAGKKKWAASTVESILKNEKYKGDALLQKAFTVDFLTKKQKKNEGEVPQYYVENSHPAIIDPAEWKLVQRELERRKAIGRSYSGNSIFSSRLVCGDCGGYFGSKVWHSTDKYRRTIWRCNSKFTGEEKCQTPHLTEEEIKARFLDAFNALVADKEQLLDECRTMQAALTDTGSLDSEIAALLSEMEVVAELTKRCIEEEFHHRTGSGRLPGTLQRPGRAVRNRQGQAGEAPGGKGPAGSQGRGHRRLYVRTGGVRRTPHRV